jgi:hypothetical protein
MQRLWRAATKDYGVQVPSGHALYGWMFWLIGALLALIGISTLISGHTVLGAALT